jgi:copper ion binding protein
VLGIPLAAGVFYPLFGWRLNPMFGAAAMSMSSVCVVLNALRLTRFRDEQAPAGTSCASCASGASDESDASCTSCTSCGSCASGESCASVISDEPGESPKEIEIKEEPVSMKKDILIEGMMCQHCVAHVEKALNGIAGVHADVSLEDKKARVTLSADVPDEALRQAVADAGYEVKSISPVK